MSWIAKQLICDGISHPQMPGGVWMEEVMMFKCLLCPRFGGRGLLRSVFHIHAIFPEISRMLLF